MLFLFYARTILALRLAPTSQVRIYTSQLTLRRLHSTAYTSQFGLRTPYFTSHISYLTLYASHFTLVTLQCITSRPHKK